MRQLPSGICAGGSTTLPVTPSASALGQTAFVREAGLRIERFNDAIDGTVMLGSITRGFCVRQVLSPHPERSYLQDSRAPDDCRAAAGDAADFSLLGVANPSTAPGILNTAEPRLRRWRRIIQVMTHRGILSSIVSAGTPVRR